LGTVSFAVSAGWRYLFPSKLAATSPRVEPFLAFVPRFLSTAAVAVAGLKMEM
jgi:hypothetical protein